MRGAVNVNENQPDCMCNTGLIARPPVRITDIVQCDVWKAQDFHVLLQPN